MDSIDLKVEQHSSLVVHSVVHFQKKTDVANSCAGLWYFLKQLVNLAMKEAFAEKKEQWEGLAEKEEEEEEEEYDEESNVEDNEDNIDDYMESEEDEVDRGKSTADHYYGKVIDTLEDAAWVVMDII